MSWFTYIVVVYGATVIALYLAFMGKPFYLIYKGDRKRVHAPLFKLCIIMFLAAFVCVLLIPHLFCRCIGLRGFGDWRDKSYTTQNPFKKGARS